MQDNRNTHTPTSARPAPDYERAVLKITAFDDTDVIATSAVGGGAVEPKLTRTLYEHKLRG